MKSEHEKQTYHAYGKLSFSNICDIVGLLFYFVFLCHVDVRWKSKNEECSCEHACLLKKVCFNLIVMCVMCVFACVYVRAFVSNVSVLERACLHAHYVCGHACVCARVCFFVVVVECTLATVMCAHKYARFDNLFKLIIPHLPSPKHKPRQLACSACHRLASLPAKRRRPAWGKRCSRRCGDTTCKLQAETHGASQADSGLVG